MVAKIIARSLSRPVAEQFREETFNAQVLAVFDQVCDLVTDRGDVVAVVSYGIGDGPLNLVVNSATALGAGIRSDASVTLNDGHLWIDGLAIDFREAVIWEPRPDWERLRAQRAAIISRLPLLRELCQARVSNSLLALLPKLSRHGQEQISSLDPRVSKTLPVAQRAVDALRLGWGGQTEQLRPGAAGLAGLGIGLTPAGDDFLEGMMLWTWLTRPTPGSFCQTLCDVAAPRTTTLSAAFLRAAARGECSAPWHALLNGLATGDEAQITASAEKILAHGATSGADSLAGFLYLGSSHLSHTPWG